MVNQLTREYLKIIRGKLPAEEMQGQPLCMEQYKKMFKAVRIPQVNKDRYIVYEADNPQHVVIYHKSRLYKVNMTDQEGAQVSKEALALTMQHMIDEPEMNDVQDDIDYNEGLFTMGCRNEAALFYDAFKCDPINKKNLDVIQRALFLCDVIRWRGNPFGSAIVPERLSGDLSLPLGEDGKKGRNAACQVKIGSEKRSHP